MKSLPRFNNPHVFILLLAGLLAARTVHGETAANLVLVSGGSFKMGDDISYYRDERPAHTVELSSFSIGRYPVTQKEYEELMGVNPSNFKGENYPVETVSWFDAAEYCNRLSQKEGLMPAYLINETDVSWDRNANGYRLPTEAEWEYAARGGKGSPGDYLYSGSNNPGEVAWYNRNSGGSIREVGMLNPNPLGLYDMSGNVFEWCWDWFGNYSADAQIDPEGASCGIYRVLRGGCWDLHSRLVRSVYRSVNSPSNRSAAIGFRVVRP